MLQNFVERFCLCHLKGFCWIGWMCNFKWFDDWFWKDAEDVE